MTTTSRTSGTGLLRRHRRHVRGASLGLSALVLLLAVLALAGPTAFTETASSEARTALADGSPTGRYLIARPDADPDEGPGDGAPPRGYDATAARLYGGYAERLAAVRDDFPRLLRSSTHAPRWAITLEGILLSPADPGATPRAARTVLSLKVDPVGRSEVHLVQGSWPGDSSSGPVPIALSVDSARALGWAVGQVRAGHVLVGTWRPRDARADYWALNPSMVEPYVNDDGNSRVVVTGTAFTSTARWKESSPQAASGYLQVWYPLDLSGVRGAELDTLVAQVRRVTATAFSRSPDTSFTLTAAGLGDLEAAQGRAGAARSVVTLAAVGPAGALAMLLLLGIRAFAARRRAAVGLLAARGAPPARLRGLLALEGLLVSVPAGLVALVLVALALRTLPTPPAVVLAVLVVLLPPAVLAASPVQAAMRPVRADVGVRRERPWAAVAGAGVLVLAAVSTYLLLSAGVGADGGQVDALVVATPLLLAAAAAVVVLRLYPLPLRLLSRRLGRGRSTISWLGSLRALRDPSVPVAPVLTVLVAVAVSVFSLVTLATVERGTAQSALAATGAQLRLDGPVVGDAAYARVERLDGVAAAARVQDLGRTTVFVEGTVPASAELYRADLAALARVQRDVRGGVPAVGKGDAVLARALGTASDRVRFGTLDALAPVDVAASARQVPGVTSEPAWLLTDASTRGDRTFAPRVLLVSLRDGADARAVAREVQELTGSRGTIALADRATDSLGSEPVVRGLRVFLLVAVLVVALAALASVVLALTMGAAARTRHLAVLRVLGVPASRRRWYAVWEQAPAVAVSLVVGGALGLVLSLTVHRVVDLTPFTGDDGQPPLVVPWVPLTVLLVVFVALVSLAIAAGTWWSGRRGPAAVMKLDEE